MLQKGHSGDGCNVALTLCKYDLRKGDSFVLSWARVRRVRRGSISSELLMCGGGMCRILLLPLVARCLGTIDVCIWRMSVGYRPLLKIVFSVCISLSCRCCMFVSCVHPVAVLSAELVLLVVVCLQCIC